MQGLQQSGEPTHTWRIEPWIERVTTMDPVFPPPPTVPESAPIEAVATGDFHAWMSQANGSIIVTTYESNQVLIIGWDGKQPCIFGCPFDRPMGLAIQGRFIALATRDRLHVLANAVPLAPDFVASDPGRHDALFVPRMTYYTGKLHVHDVGSGKDGIWFVNTKFSCLAVPSLEYSFVPRWKPSFITELEPDDLCHLNGLAMDGGSPRFVTALGSADVMKQGWRPERLNGGVVIDVPTNQIVVRGPMPAAFSARPYRLPVVAQFGDRRISSSRSSDVQAGGRLRLAGLRTRTLSRGSLRSRRAGHHSSETPGRRLSG